VDAAVGGVGGEDEDVEVVAGVTSKARTTLGHCQKRGSFRLGGTDDASPPGDTLDTKIGDDVPTEGL
jgi:hypothetical protein